MSSLNNDSRLDYSKWDALDVSDDEKENAEVSNIGGYVQLDEGRGALRRQVEGLLKKQKVCEEDAGLIAQFVAIQRRDIDSPCNANRHVEIIDFLAKRPILSKPETTQVLCASASERFEEKDNPTAILLVEAVNTLEATRRYNGALAFFAAICTPTTPRAEAMRDHYARQTFGQLRLKRYMYRNLLTQNPELEQVLLDHEYKELASIDPPPPPPPPPKPTSLASRLFWWIGLPFCILAAVAFYSSSTRNFDNDSRNPTEQTNE
mmetsp:Transcript_8800/g.13515  ORF Transcript_8800/g.13515 Transcript_8800/m.13515 type:complete len:263 (-) Transcript_8800:66-854(-)